MSHIVPIGAALVIVGLYVARTLETGPRLGFPLDDAYIYMTYAKQIARGHPFTYFDGGGYSAGATSQLWPLLLAPLWGLGLRGHLFCWGVLGACAALLATSACLCVAIARRVLGRPRGDLVGLLGAVLVVSSGTVSWNYLAGMEVPLAATLILACVLRLLDEEQEAPSRLLLALLCATALARPEAGVLVVAIAGGRAAAAALRARFGAALLWLVPLAAPLLVALVNRALTGHLAPNTAIVKSHVYLPGFDWPYWWATVEREGRAMFHALFWSGRRGLEPLWLPRLTLALWLLGAARVIVWGARARRLSGALALALAPLAIFAAVLGVSAMWSFHNYRYIAAGLPPLLLTCALGLALPARVPARIAGAAAALLVLAAAWGGRGFLDRDRTIFAQGARDNNAQVVRIGQWIDANLPRDAFVAIHDVGAIGYYSNRRLLDVIGLVTNGQAEVCNNGPGARFEAFERTPPERRPTHFAYYAGWLLTGSRDLFGAQLFAATAPPPLGGPRMLGSDTMTVFEARWDLLGSGAAPLDAGGWTVADEVDVADLVSEREHGWRADLGPRRLDTPTANWSVYLSAPVAGRTIADGGRTVRGARGERFAVEADPARPLRLVVRTGGPIDMAGSSVSDRARALVVIAGGRELGRLAIPRPAPAFAEASLELPADPARPRRLELEVRAADGGPYRVYHWFALQPS